MTLCCRATVTQPRSFLGGAKEAKIWIIPQSNASRFNWLHRCLTQTSPAYGAVHTNLTTRQIFFNPKWCCRNRVTRSPRQQVPEEVVVPGRAVPGTEPWPDEPMEECWFRVTEHKEGSGFRWPEGFGIDERNSDHKGLTSTIKKTPEY